MAVLIRTTEGELLYKSLFILTCYVRNPPVCVVPVTLRLILNTHNSGSKPTAPISKF